MNRLLILALILLPSAASGLALDRGPYLQRVGPTEVTLVFRSDDPCDGELSWGTAPDTLDFTLQTGLSLRQHEAVLGGLTPSTRYWYRFLCNGLDLDAETPAAERWFDSAPAAGSRAPLRAWIVGDSGTGSFGQLNARDAAMEHWQGAPPDLFLHMGDMAYGSGTDPQFTLWFYGIYRDVLRTVPVFPTMGNHEGYTANALSEEGAYYEGYVLPSDGRLGGVPSGTEAYYSFDWGNVHFVVLESHQSDRTPDGPMLTWLAEDLAATDAEWLVAYWHHPPYTKGSHDSDEETAHIQMREWAVPILEAGGVDLVLGGHSHIYERTYLVQGSYETPSTDAGIVDARDGRPLGDGPYVLEPGLAADDGSLYVVAGHGGANVRQEGEHPLVYFAEAENGSVLMDVSGNRMSLRNVRHDGEVTDRVTLIKGDGIDVAWPDGGEVLLPGSEVPVRWRSTGLEGGAVVEWTCDDGETWNHAADARLEDDSARWTVPLIQAPAARVRVRALAGDTSDMSDGTFRLGGQPVPATPVPLGSTWLYSDDGKVVGADWMQPDRDDGRWPEGDSPLGFGQGDEVTTLDEGARTYYFRHTFWLDSTVGSASWLIRYDDGFAVWVNGELAGSRNMENGFGLSDWASASTAARQTAEGTLAPTRLVGGWNTLAVMVKQAPGSTGLGFDMQLDVQPPAEALPFCGPESTPEVPEVPPLTEGCTCGDGNASILPLLVLVGLPLRRRGSRAG